MALEPAPSDIVLRLVTNFPFTCGDEKFVYSLASCCCRENGDEETWQPRMILEIYFYESFNVLFAPSREKLKNDGKFQLRGDDTQDDKFSTNKNLSLEFVCCLLFCVSWERQVNVTESAREMMMMKFRPHASRPLFFRLLIRFH